MRFSIRTMLLTVTVVGAVLGVMVKLLLVKPELFFQVLGIASTVGPFVLAIGTIAWLALKRRPLPSQVLCARCKHSVPSGDPKQMPHCPECQADLTLSGALLAVLERKRRWGLLGWAAALLLMPLVVPLAYMVALPSGNPIQILSTQRLIDDRLPAKIDEPWVWDELKRRLKQVSLSQAESDAAVRKLITHMKRTRPTGWGQPMHWQEDFLQAAIQAKVISDEVLIDLCDAFYGTTPVVQPLRPIKEGKSDFQLRIDFGNTWGELKGPGLVLLWDVDRVLVDGKPLKVQRLHKFNESWSGQCRGELAPGQHKVTVEIQCGYVGAGKLAGVDQDSLKVERWPEARKRWKKTVTAPLKVIPAKQAASRGE